MELSPLPRPSACPLWTQQTRTLRESSVTAGLTCWLVSPGITLPSAAGLLVFEVVSYALSGAFCLLCDCSQESKSNLSNYILVRIRSTSLQIPLLSQKKTWMGRMGVQQVQRVVEQSICLTEEKCVKLVCVAE